MPPVVHHKIFDSVKDHRAIRQDVFRYIVASVKGEVQSVVTEPLGQCNAH